MGAAIWSTSEHGIGDVPAESFVRFFSNHNLLQMVQPTWRTIKGGSRVYVDPRLAAILGPRVRVRPRRHARALRLGAGVEVTDAAESVSAGYDQVILASPLGPGAWPCWADADGEERALLWARSVMRPTALFPAPRDPALMPRRKRSAWGSWNYIADPAGGPGAVSYWMNSLQAIDPSRPLFVSLNPSREPDPVLTFGVYDYDHPRFDIPALAAQRRFGRIQGRGGVWYAGAWLGYGFHEDGLTAGLRVARALGGEVPWAFVDHRIEGGAPRLAARETARRAAA